MNIAQFLRDQIVAPLVVTVLASIIIGIASQISTGYWMTWFDLIPITAWKIFGIIIILWIIIARSKQLQKSNTGPRVIIGPLKWTPIGKLPFAGVVWKLRASEFALMERTIRPNIDVEIDVEIPPRCPECETELEESHSFWGLWYNWSCVRCGFQKRNRHSYYQEQERAKKLARREWEELEQKPRF